jgi:hypothetical protein
MAFRGDIRDRVGWWISQGRRGKGRLAILGILVQMGLMKRDWLGTGRHDWHREAPKGRTVCLVGERPEILIMEIVEDGIGTYQVSLV